MKKHFFYNVEGKASNGITHAIDGIMTLECDKNTSYKTLLMTAHNLIKVNHSLTDISFKAFTPLPDL